MPQVYPTCGTQRQLSGATVGGVTYNYITQNDQVVRQTWGDHVMDFIYDNTGKPYALKYDGTTYYYVLNLQEDVISIITHWGESYGSYTYDAWGNVLSVSGDIASLNPIRYRGYYYDSETRLYYLGSRYYDPQVKRFINADDSSVLGVEQGSMLQYNLFSYCLNNPANRTDVGGNLSLPNIAKVAIGAVATIAAVGITVATGGAAAPVLIGVATSTLSGAAIGYATGGKEGAINGAASGFMWGGLGAMASSAASVIKAVSAARKGITIGENMVLSICACVFFRSTSFLRASFACRLPSKARPAFSRNSAFQFRSIFGLMLFSAAMVLSSFSPCSTSMTSLALYSGVYVLRVMVSSPFHFLAVFYHVHDNFSSCGLKLWDHYILVQIPRAGIPFRVLTAVF